MDDLTGGVFLELLDDGNKLRSEAVVVHQSPNDISVHAVKCLLKVNEDCMQRGLPLQRLLYDDAHGSNVVSARAILSEAYLLVTELLVQDGLQSL